MKGHDLPNDHRPAHVHVIGHGCEAVFNLNCPKGPVTLRENYWFARRDVARIKAMLASSWPNYAETGRVSWQSVTNLS